MLAAFDCLSAIQPCFAAAARIQFSVNNTLSLQAAPTQHMLRQVYFKNDQTGGVPVPDLEQPNATGEADNRYDIVDMLNGVIRFIRLFNSRSLWICTCEVKHTKQPAL
jgi:hypothetical protein